MTGPRLVLTPTPLSAAPDVVIPGYHWSATFDGKPYPQVMKAVLTISAADQPKAVVDVVDHRQITSVYSAEEEHPVPGGVYLAEIGGVLCEARMDVYQFPPDRDMELVQPEAVTA